MYNIKSEPSKLWCDYYCNRTAELRKHGSGSRNIDRISSKEAAKEHNYARANTLAQLAALF